MLREDFEVLCPGHGPVVRDANAKLDEYVAHRLDRERRLLEALEDGKRTADELLNEVPLLSGPYVAVRLDPPRRIEFKRNPSYWADGLGVRRGFFNWDRTWSGRLSRHRMHGPIRPVGGERRG